MPKMPITKVDAEVLNLGSRPGYNGIFTRDEYPGALRNGTRVIKANSEAGDITKDGSFGTVMGSIGHPELGPFYFIEWDNKPSFVIGCVAKKLRREP